MNIPKDFLSKISHQLGELSFDCGTSEQTGLKLIMTAEKKKKFVRGWYDYFGEKVSDSVFLIYFQPSYLFGPFHIFLRGDCQVSIILFRKVANFHTKKLTVNPVVVII